MGLIQVCLDWQSVNLPAEPLELLLQSMVICDKFT